MSATAALPLDSDRWAELEHAYGEASDVPAWLEALGRGDETIEWDEEGEVEIWHPIWSALCHQGSVHTASHAAVPHLVALALAQEPAARRPYWQIVGAIAVSDDAPPIPADLEPAYRGALAAALDAVPASIAADDAVESAWAVASMAALSGEPALERAVEGLIDEEMPWECPSCSGFGVVATDVLPFRATIEGAGGATVAAPAEPRPLIARLATLAQDAGHPALATRIRALECVLPCPRCGATAPLIPR
jgi:hypothetical protein